MTSSRFIYLLIKYRKMSLYKNGKLYTHYSWKEKNPLYCRPVIVNHWKCLGAIDEIATDTQWLKEKLNIKS